MSRGTSGVRSASPGPPSDGTTIFLLTSAFNFDPRPKQGKLTRNDQATPSSLWPQEADPRADPGPSNHSRREGWRWGCWWGSLCPLLRHTAPPKLLGVPPSLGDLEAVLLGLAGPQREARAWQTEAGQAGDPRMPGTGVAVSEGRVGHPGVSPPHWCGSALRGLEAGLE